MDLATAERTATAAATPYRWTRAQYERMIEAGVLGEDDRVELLNGRIVAMSPQKSRHSTLLVLLEQEVREAYGPGYFVRVQLPLGFDPDSEPEPDLAVVAGEPRDYLGDHPTTAVLVAEVADTSLLLDRTEKAGLYAEHGIREYWLLNVRDEALEVYRDPADGTYQTKTTLHRGDSITPPEATRTIEVADVLP